MKAARFSAVVLSAILAFAAAGCASAPSTKNIPAVPSIDFGLFEGPWYEIARIPIPIAGDWVGTTDTYIRRADGDWDVLYEGWKGGFDGKKGSLGQRLRAVDPVIQGEMEAKPFPFVWMPYRIVYWNAEDETMLITSGTMNYLWVMARAPLLDSAVYDRLTAEADRLGFDIALLETVPQRPERGL